MSFTLSSILTLLALMILSQNSQALTCHEVYSLRAGEKTAELQEVREIWLSFARKAGANSDFKYLADLILKQMSFTERAELVQKAKDYRRQIYDRLIEVGFDVSTAQRLSQTAYVRRILDFLFESRTQIRNIPASEFGKRLKLVDSQQKTNLNFENLKKMFQALELTWPHLVKRMAFYAGGSLLKVRDIFFVAGGRFRESYYWDSYFGAMGLVKTGRVDLVVRQMKKFVNDINQYGLIPNGNRSYYLTRSQPPVVSLMARLIYENTRNLEPSRRNEIDQWLQGEVLRALEKDYSEFWMKERLDQETGLNTYSDKLNLPRPEAHSKDKSSEIANSEKDVRAEAESGLDFTNTLGGRASQTLSVQLNAFLFAYENNLSWLYGLKGDSTKSEFYKAQAEKRKDLMDQYLRDESGLYRNYHLDTKTLNEGISGEIFSLLFVKALTPQQARVFIPEALKLLEKDGGIAASTFFNSKKQWDGKYGWAPFQMMAVQGLMNYGHHGNAKRLMEKWVQTNLNVFMETGQFYEKVDVTTMQLPKADNSKYPNQVGFLWTNSSIVWMLSQMGYNFK